MCVLDDRFHPLFFVHQCNLDRLYDSFLARYGINEARESFKANQQAMKDAPQTIVQIAAPQRRLSVKQAIRVDNRNRAVAKAKVATAVQEPNRFTEKLQPFARGSEVMDSGAAGFVYDKPFPPLALKMGDDQDHAFVVFADIDPSNSAASCTLHVFLSAADQFTPPTNGYWTCENYAGSVTVSNFQPQQPENFNPK